MMLKKYMDSLIALACFFSMSLCINLLTYQIGIAISE